MDETIQVTRIHLTSRKAQALIDALNAELSATYPEEGANHFDLDAAEVAPGRGAFLVVQAGHETLGCGAVRLIEGGAAEVKRMFVVPSARGRGISRRILTALEDEARALGATQVVLETGVRQAAALGLYVNAGYVRIEAFGEYVDSPLSVCMAKELVASNNDL